VNHNSLHRFSLHRAEPVSTNTAPVRRAARHPGVIAIAVAALLWGLYGPIYLVYTVNSAIATALAALGLAILVGWGREISLATAGIFGSSVYIFGYYSRPETGHGWPWVPAAVLVIVLAAGVMAGLAMISRRLPGIYLVMLTLGAQVVIENTIFTFGSYSGGIGGADDRGRSMTNKRPGFFGLHISDGFSFFGRHVSGESTFYFFSLFLLAVILMLVTRLRHSPYGLAFLLVGTDRQAASAIGIPAQRIRAAIFATSGALVACGGILACWLYINPPIFLNYQAPYSLVLLAIPVLAGLDSIAFVVLTAVLFQVTPVALEHYRVGSYMIAGLGLLAGAAFGSRGVGGRSRDLTRFLLYGPRRDRTNRGRLDTETLRHNDGLAVDGVTQLGAAQRERALAVLTAWLPQRPPGEIALTASDVKVHIGGVKALDGASIEVPTGRMVGLIGPNGAGKSTLFDVISGLRVPNAGRITLFGTDVTDRQPWDRAKLGMARTFQATRVVPDLTVADNLVAGAYQRIKETPLSWLAGLPSTRAKLRAAEAAAYAAAQLLDVDRYWNERCSTLEFSARRRVEIGRCLLSGPRLLLMDEPAAGLDPASTVALFSLIRRLHAELGLTVLLVEHYVKAVLSTCDYVYVLAEGLILASGSPADVAANPAVQSRYLGTRMLARGISAAATPAAMS
jgi:ABC-type branched-subunit amino acid transport system ATPase component/ABC-type branched-subunit amino acid transport system permease subunit